MNPIHLLIYVCCALPFVAAAQSTGLRCDDAKYQQVNRLPVYSGTKYNEIPLRVSLKKYCPIPGNQGQAESCVGWAVGYGAMTIINAQRQGVESLEDVTAMAHSAAFVYNQIKLTPDDCKSGAYIEDALLLLKNTGDCLERSFNYASGGCEAMPESSHLAEATQYRIQDYATVFSLQEGSKSKISKSCSILATETPLVVGMGVPSSFFDIKPGAVVWHPAPDEEILTYHAMVLVGYDNVTKQFELMNSFGTSWAYNGFIKVAFDDFARYCRYAYVLLPSYEQPSLVATPVPATNEAEKLNLAGEFVFRKPAGYLTLSNGEEAPYFEEVGTHFDASQGYYRTLAANFPVGEVFQLVARNIPRGRYVYVFSQTNGEQVNVHFPKNTAGFILERTAEIIIPSEERVLQLPKIGADYLCILYSNGAIPKFEERIQGMNDDQGDFFSAVQKHFADVLIPNEAVSFYPDRMAFYASSVTNSARTVVPLILRVEAR